MRGTRAAIVWAALLAAGCESTAGDGGAAKEEAGAAAAKESKGGAAAAPAKDPWAGTGFAVYDVDGRWWVFREGSKENAAFVTEFGKGILPEKSVTRIGGLATMKALDAETLDAFEAWKPGYAIRWKDGRIWVFRMDAKELAEFSKSGDLAKHVTRIGAGPGGRTLKAPDAETLDAWAAEK